MTHDVCAAIPTRGNVDLGPILATLPYAEIRVRNERYRAPQGCYGRYLAAYDTRKPLIYLQDDDLLFTAHEELLALYEPGKIVCNMPSPWYEQTGYDRLDQCLVGAGSIMDAGLPYPAIDKYLNEYPADDLFYDYCDVVVGMLTPYVRVDLGYEVLPYASDPGRIHTSPGAQERKEEMQRRVKELRDRG